jgi:hypothetical protein
MTISVVAIYDTDYVIARLEEAGAAMLALPQRGYSTRLRMTQLDVVADVAEAYGWSPVRLRPAVPDAGKISRMDEAMGWLSYIPEDRHVIRRVVAARSLVDPINGRHLYSWRKLGAVLRSDHKAVQRWHKLGVAEIVRVLAA